VTEDGNDDEGLFPADYNRTNSPTGRVFRGAPPSVYQAADLTDARNHRAIVLRMLIAAHERGVTSKEAAARMPRTRDGDRQLSNRSSSRLQELWEMGAATIIREHGACILGVCHLHDKPRTVHRPSASCSVHGLPIRREGANIWRITSTTEREASRP